VGRPRADGLHPLGSLFASIELEDRVTVEPADRDLVECPAVPGHNLAALAVGVFREAVPDLPPLAVRIDKRIPVAAGLAGGSADAAAVLRAVNELAGRPLDAAGLRELAARLGSDVPSQVEPRHALVSGVGERVEPLRLPQMALVLVPQREGLATADVYAELDRLGRGRDRIEHERLRPLAGVSLRELADAVENDLEPAALSLRPELEEPLRALRDAGALAAAISGSGPTAFGVFERREDAARAAEALAGAVVTETRDAA
jgi:4-diphosphocytidyl-2-C-methyl-D-erythritol kinase